MVMLPTELDMVSIYDTPYSTHDIVFSPMEDAAYSPTEIPNSHSQCESLNSIFATPTVMSFREKCAFLDEVYNSYSDTDLVSAKNLDAISKRAGLPMEEVLAWFEDEKERRAKLSRTENSVLNFPPSPAWTNTTDSTATIGMSQCVPSPRTVAMDEFTSAVELFNACGTFKIPESPMRARRGRPAKNRFPRHSNSPYPPDAKRQKCSTKYPCPDCDNVLTADRWSEHVKRVHFPEQVWECPKVNQRTRKLCGSKPFFRPDNFATHLRGEHGCGVEEISQLKSDCRFRTVGLFHEICGFCEETFETREGSIEHIKDHFKEISERANPPADLGISEWKERCKSEHKLKRGVHYHISDETDHDPPDRDQEGDDDGPPGQGGPHNRSNRGPQDHPHKHAPDSGKDGDRDSGGFYYCANSNYIDYQRYPTFGLEGIVSSNTTFVDPSITRQPCFLDPISNELNNSVQLYPSSPKLSAPPEPSRLSPDVPPPSHTHSPNLPQYSSYKCRPSERSSVTSNRSLHLSSQNNQCSPSQYLDSSGFSQIPRSPRPIKQDSQSPYLSSQYSLRPYPPPRRPSVVTHHSYSSQGNLAGEETMDKGKCTYPECGKVFKDLKAHMLTHQNERPEKCPITTCDYHIKGFARKYDKMRHTLTHYKGTMICGFCPSSAEKSFNRADVFKRHLTSVHGVEQTPPNSRRKSTKPTTKTLSDYALDSTGKCSTCNTSFNNAQDFYEHLDDCVLRIIQQDEPLKAINARRLIEVEKDQDVYEALRSNALSTTITKTNDNHHTDTEAEEDDSEDFDNVNDEDFSLCSRTSRIRSPESKRKTNLGSQSRKKCKDYPSSWGTPTMGMKMKKRVLCVFDGSRGLWKDDMMPDTDYETRLKLGGEKSYITDLDIQTMRRADCFQNATEEEKGLWIADDLADVDLEKLMEVQGEY